VQDGEAVSAMVSTKMAMRPLRKPATLLTCRQTTGCGAVRLAFGHSRLSSTPPAWCSSRGVSGRRRREASGQMGDGEAQIEVAIESMCIEARSADPMASTANVASSSVSTTKRRPLSGASDRATARRSHSGLTLALADILSDTGWRKTSLVELRGFEPLPRPGYLPPYLRFRSRILTASRPVKHV
jgi:hypothetical protein